MTFTLDKCLRLKEKVLDSIYLSYTTRLLKESMRLLKMEQDSKIKELEKKLEQLEKEIERLEKYNNDLKRLCDIYEEEHNTMFKIWSKDKLDKK